MTPDGRLIPSPSDLKNTFDLVVDECKLGTSGLFLLNDPQYLRSKSIDEGYNRICNEFGG